MADRSRMPAVLDLFAGCGGLSKGLEKAGFDIVAANDIWEPAKLTYELNHPGVRFILGDITDPKVKEAILAEFRKRPCDVLVGGPPCQAYSVAGLRDPDDPRGRLFEDYVDLVRKLGPKLFLMENVKGILSMEHERDDLAPGDMKKLSSIRALEEKAAALRLKRKQSKNTPQVEFTEADRRELLELAGRLGTERRHFTPLREKVTDKIVRRFRDIGYRVEFRVLNAADFGVPQKRERVIFIGTRFPLPVHFPPATHSRDGQATLEGATKRWLTVRDAVEDLKDRPEDLEVNHELTRHGKAFAEKIRSTPVGRSVFGDYSDSFYRNPPDEPARTVKENHGGVLVHYERDRVMTPRELARLQSFGDDFRFAGSKKDVLVQIGNAVPPKLGEALGRSLKKMLLDIERARGAAPADRARPSS